MFVASTSILELNNTCKKSYSWYITKKGRFHKILMKLIQNSEYHYKCRKNISYAKRNNINEIQNHYY